MLFYEVHVALPALLGHLAQLNENGAEMLLVLAHVLIIIQIVSIAAFGLLTVLVHDSKACACKLQG